MNSLHILQFAYVLVLTIFNQMMTHKSLRTVSSKNEHVNYGNCKTESVEHSCSFITGALIERIH